MTVTADAQSKVYGDADPTFTYPITSGSLAFTDAFSGALERDGGEDVGPYAITQGDLSLGGNYDLTFVGADLEITPALLTVTPDDQERLYGDANPEFTYDFSGFKFLDDDSVVTGEAECSTTADELSNVADSPYPITCDVSGLSAENYSFTPAPGELTVLPAELTVTANDQERAYGAANPALTYSITGFVNGDDELVVSGIALCSTTATVLSSVAASPYPITCDVSGLSADNYTFAAAPGDLTVLRAELTVTADPQSKVYGEDNPAAFTYSISGFQNDENEAVVTGEATCSTIADETTPAGAHPITCDVTGLSADNYFFTSSDGTLTITQRPVEVTADPQSKVYGEEDPELTYQITAGNLVNGDDFNGELSRVVGRGRGYLRDHPG